MPATTVKATSSSTSRCGASSGMTNAAASVTTPRMPAQPMRKVHDAGSGFSPWRRNSQVTKTQPSRTTITVARVAPQTSGDAAGRQGRLA